MAWFFPGRAPARQIEDDLSGSTVLQTGGRAKRIRAEGIDWSILFITGFLLAFGSLMVYSASISLADSPKFDTSYTHFFVRHLISIAVAAVAGSIVYRIPMRFWESRHHRRIASDRRSYSGSRSQRKRRPALDRLRFSDDSGHGNCKVCGLDRRSRLYCAPAGIHAFLYEGLCPDGAGDGSRRLSHQHAA